MDQYRLNLAIVSSAVPLGRRSYHPQDCISGKQFDPRDVRSLPRLSSLGLTDGATSLAVFMHLEKLNLRGNGIQDLRALGIDRLQELKILDVSSNAIATPVAEIGSLLHSLGALQVFVIEGNPCMKKYESSRLALIGSVDRMREVRGVAGRRCAG